MGSILLAFAIDAVWEERGERAEERMTLEALRREFTLNRTLAAEVVNVHARIQDRFARFASMSREEVLGLEPDSVLVFTASLAAPRTFEPVLGTVDALVGAGKLGIIEDPALREGLATFLNLVEDATEDARYMGAFAERTWESWIEHGGPWQAPTPVNRSGRPTFLTEPTAAGLAEVWADPELMGLARQTHLRGWVYAGEVEIIRAQADSILALIEAGVR